MSTALSDWVNTSPALFDMVNMSPALPDMVNMSTALSDMVNTSTPLFGGVNLYTTLYDHSETVNSEDKEPPAHSHLLIMYNSDVWWLVFGGIHSTVPCTHKRKQGTRVKFQNPVLLFTTILKKMPDKFVCRMWCVHACACVCMCPCVYVCVCVWGGVCMCVCVHVCWCVCMCVCELCF